MTKIFSICLALLAATTLTAPAQTQHIEVNVGDFTTLTVLDNINVVYHSDASRAGTATIDCTQEVANGLMFSNNTRGKLTIQLTPELFGKSNLPTISVYSTVLSMVENAGDSTITLEKVKPLNTFKVILSDNGHVILKHIDVDRLDLSLVTGKGVITASGKCVQLNATVLGKGSIDALEVTAQKVKCSMMGTGTIDCQADGIELNVRGSGTGRINYLGKPSKLNVRKLGPLKVTPLDP